MKTHDTFFTVAIAALFVGACASTIYGTKPVEAVGPGQIAVDVGYRTVDKVYIATARLAPTGRFDKATLQSALETAYASELATDIVFLPPSTARRSRTTSAEIISDATAVLAASLEMAAADQVFDAVIRQMQAEGDRQMLTTQEMKTLKDKLMADRSAAQVAMSRLE